MEQSGNRGMDACIYARRQLMGCSTSDNFLATGTLNGKGQFYGTSGTAAGVKMFYCENFYGN